MIAPPFHPGGKPTTTIHQDGDSQIALRRLREGRGAEELQRAAARQRAGTWNSNDADVCCTGGSTPAFIIWGASTAGGKSHLLARLALLDERHRPAHSTPPSRCRPSSGA